MKTIAATAALLALLMLHRHAHSAEMKVSSLEELRAALEKAQAGDVTRILSGAVINLKDQQIVVPEKVTLNGEGATITAEPVGDRAAIALRPGSRLTGLRLVGPNPLFEDIDSLPLKPSGYAVSCADAEVDHCEILKFQRGGIALFRDSVKAHIHHNWFLMHEKTGSKEKFRPYGRAIRLVGLQGHSAIEDDPQPPKDTWKVSIRDNMSGRAK